MLRSMIPDLTITLAIGARNWVHSRIWRSRDCFLSTSPTRKTAIAPFLRDTVYRTTRACSLQSPRGACLHSAQAVLCRRRHQPRRPSPANSRPGSPAPAMGPGTALNGNGFGFCRVFEWHYPYRVRAVARRQPLVVVRRIPRYDDVSLSGASGHGW